MESLNQRTKAYKQQISDYPLQNCVVLLVTFVLTPVVPLPDSLKPEN